MFNYEAQEYHSKQRHAEAIAAAEKHRLAQTCQPEQVALSSQILASIGDVLVNVGSRLQEQRSTVNQSTVYHLESSSL